ncbi:MAG: RNA polymerase sigma factor [Pseudomonadota bacterium]
MSNQFKKDLVDLVPRLRRFALSLAGNQADADDLVQSACVKALKNEAQFRRGTRMDSWMYRIIQTLWIDDRRRAKTRGTMVDAEDAGLSDGGRAARLPEDRMMLDQAKTAMAGLEENQRTVLSLVAIEGLSYKETADVLDLPIGTVMSRLSRARAALLPQLGMTKGPMQ